MPSEDRRRDSSRAEAEDGGAAMPGAAMPGGAAPGGAVPRDAVPHGAVPHGAVPHGAAPGAAPPGGGSTPGGGVAPVPAVCTGVVKEYRTVTGTVRALRGIDATFPAGQVTVIAGPSGSGKSSLLRILACVDRPTAGSVRIGGQEVASLSARARRRLRRRLVSYVFQDPADNLLPYLSVDGHMELAARMRGGELPGERERLLDALGLGHRRDHKPEQLSGGEQQRLAFAAAVLGSPAVVIADEPTAELDHNAGASLLEAVRSLRDAGTSLVLSSHDAMVVDAADQVLRLRNGRLVVDGAA